MITQHHPPAKIRYVQPSSDLASHRFAPVEVLLVHSSNRITKIYNFNKRRLPRQVPQSKSGCGRQPVQELSVQSIQGPPPNRLPNPRKSPTSSGEKVGGSRRKPPKENNVRPPHPRVPVKSLGTVQSQDPCGSSPSRSAAQALKTFRPSNNCLTKNSKRLLLYTQV